MAEIKNESSMYDVVVQKTERQEANQNRQVGESVTAVSNANNFEPQYNAKTLIFRGTMSTTIGGVMLGTAYGVEYWLSNNPDAVGGDKKKYVTMCTESLKMTGGAMLARGLPDLKNGLCKLCFGDRRR